MVATPRTVIRDSDMTLAIPPASALPGRTMPTKARLLIIEDDASLRKALDLYLTRCGYDVCHAGDGIEGLGPILEVQPDLVILNVMMPNLDGWDTCRRIRDLSTVPIIMLTGQGSVEDRVMGLKLGADDYVPKPFSPKELAARIEAVLRRTRATDEDKKPRLLRVSDERIGSERSDVQSQGELLDLTTTETRLLFYLAENAGRVLSHEQVLQHVWGPGHSDKVDDTRLFIWRLWRKIERVVTARQAGSDDA